MKNHTILGPQLFVVAESLIDGWILREAWSKVSLVWRIGYSGIIIPHMCSIFTWGDFT